jgi:hypothetical protein
MTKAFLEITMKIAPENRSLAGEVYSKDRQPFLSGIPGAKSKDLLLRAESRAGAARLQLEGKCRELPWKHALPKRRSHRTEALPYGGSGDPDL